MGAATIRFAGIPKIKYSKAGKTKNVEKILKTNYNLIIALGVKTIMLRRVIFLIMAIMTFSVTALANEWTYVGRFVLPKNIQHTNDTLILNHLRPFSGQSFDSFKWFNVYYHHDHSTDVYKDDGVVLSVSINFQGKIVPLDIAGKEMQYSGVNSGTIVSDVSIQNKGVYGVCPQNFRIFDSVTHQQIFAVQGAMSSEALNRSTAAEYIANISGPHTGNPGMINGN